MATKAKLATEAESTKPITKAALMAQLAEKSGCTNAAAKKMLDALSEIIRNELRSTGVATLPGVAKFVVKERPARKGRNPATGEEIDLPASKVVKAVLLKELKDTLAG